MATDEEIASTDQDVFNEAVADKPVAEAQPKEEAPKAEANDGRQRDDKGRFIAKAEGEAVVEQPQPGASPAVEQPKEERPDSIPSWRLKEEADARRESERRAQQLEAVIAQYEQRLQALQPKPEPQKFPDIFAEPEALPTYIERVLAERESKWQQDFKAAVANMSLQRAHDKHGDTFLKAFEEITSRPVSDPLRQQVINSPDPGETLVQIYRREQTIAQVGDDPVAFKQKTLEEALNDPQFLAKALERAKAAAGAQPTQKIDLPPSLNKVAAAASSADTDDMSDRSVYSFATR